MTQRGKLIDSFLSKERKDWRYDELATILAEFGYQLVSSDASHRTWKHPEDPLVITIKEGSGHQLRAYARDVRIRINAFLKRRGDV